MSNPQFMRTMIQSNPMLQQMAQANPEIEAILSNPEMMRAMMTPENMRMAQSMMQSMPMFGMPRPPATGMPGTFPASTAEPTVPPSTNPAAPPSSASAPPPMMSILLFY